MRSSTARSALFGPYALDLRSGELRKFGTKVKMGEQSFQILCLLLDAQGELVTREEFRTKLWSADTFVDFDHGLNSAVQRLRDCLSDSAESPRWIETVPRRGYRFLGRVDWQNDDEAAPVLDSERGGSKNLSGAEAPVGGTTESEGKPATRHWSGAVGMSAVIVLAVFLLAWLTVGSVPRLPRVTRTLQLTSDGLDKFPPIATDGVRIYFTELRNDHWTLSAIPISGGEATAIPLPFPDAQVVNISPDKSELLIGEGGPISDVQLWRVPILTGSPHRLGNIIAHSAGWSPDGQKLVFMRGGDVFLADGDGSDPRKLEIPASRDTWAWTPRWSSDGSHITFEQYVLNAHVSSIWEVSAKGENPHVLLPNWHEGSQCCGVWSPDGSFFFFDAWKGLEGGPPLAPAPDIWAIAKQSAFLRETKAEPIQLTAGPVHFFTHTFSADGKSLFAFSTQRREELSQFDPKAKRFFPYPGLGPAHSIGFSPDGWVAYTKFPQGELWKKKADGSDALQLTFRPLMAYEPQWSPDGKQIVFYGQELGQRWGLYLISADGGKARRINQETSNDLYGPSWSPDGGSIIFESSVHEGAAEIHVLNLATNEISKIPGSEGMGWPRWSPDNKYIAAISSDIRLLLFDINTKQWINLIPYVGSDAWSKDGKSIYVIAVRPEPGVFRFSIADKHLTKIADLSGVHVSNLLGQSLFLDPEDQPLVPTQSDLQTEIYQLFLDGR